MAYLILLLQLCVAGEVPLDGGGCAWMPPAAPVPCAVGAGWWVDPATGAGSCHACPTGPVLARDVPAGCQVPAPVVAVSPVLWARLRGRVEGLEAALVSEREARANEAEKCLEAAKDPPPPPASVSPWLTLSAGVGVGAVIAGLFF